MDLIEEKRLVDKYISIFGENKTKLLFRNPEIKDTILKLSDIQLEILNKCISNYEYMNKNADVIDIFLNIWKHLDEYSELMKNFKKSQDIDIEKLIKILQDKNILGIKSASDIENFEQIRKRKCDKWIQGNIEDKRKAVLYKIFGQSVDYTQTIIEKFGKDIENIKDGDEKDYLQSLIAIMELNDETTLSEIYNNVDEIELLDKSVIETNLKQVFCKMFNEGLLDPNKLQRIDNNQLEDELKGFEVYDAGTDFKILMTSIAPFYDTSLKNYYKDWNRLEINSQYFCTNYLRNDMLGRVYIKHLSYGFKYMEDNSLFLSGKEDIGARIPKTATLKYRLLNIGQEYLSPNTMINETEHYNEMDYKRIQNGVRKQPDYILVFRENGRIEHLNEVIQCAKDWKRKLPIVIVDIDKCLQSERQKVHEMLNQYHISPSKNLAKQIMQKVRNNRVTNPEFCIDLQELETIEKLDEPENNTKERTIEFEELAENYGTVTALEREKITTEMRQLHNQIQKIIDKKEQDYFEK